MDERPLQPSLIDINSRYIYRLHDLFRKYEKGRDSSRSMRRKNGMALLKPIVQEIALLLGPKLTPSIDLNIFAAPDYEKKQMINPSDDCADNLPCEEYLLVTHCVKLKSPAILQMLASVHSVSFSSVPCFLEIKEENKMVGNVCDHLLARHIDEANAEDPENHVFSRMRQAYCVARGVNDLLEKVTLFHITYHEESNTRVFNIVAREKYAGMLQDRGYCVVCTLDAPACLPSPSAKHIRHTVRNADTEARVAELARLICSSVGGISDRNSNDCGGNADCSSKSHHQNAGNKNFCGRCEHCMGLL